MLKHHNAHASLRSLNMMNLLMSSGVSEEGSLHVSEESPVDH